jgi:hypothetical protein
MYKLLITNNTIYNFLLFLINVLFIFLLSIDNSFYLFFGYNLKFCVCSLLFQTQSVPFELDSVPPCFHEIADVLMI